MSQSFDSEEGLARSNEANPLEVERTSADYGQREREREQSNKKQWPWIDIITHIGHKIRRTIKNCLPLIFKFVVGV